MNKTSDIIAAKLLTYTGVLPFFICIAAILLNVQQVNGAFIAICYGAVIASFLSGIHWGIYLLSAQQFPVNLFILSNVTALFAWLSLLMPYSGGLFLQILCFGYLLMLDYRLFKENIIPNWYYQLRVEATGVVILACIILADIS